MTRRSSDRSAQQNSRSVGFEVGDIVHDTTQGRNDLRTSPAIVASVPAHPAEEHMYHEYPRSVPLPEHRNNQQFPKDSPVVLIVFTQGLNDAQRLADMPINHLRREVANSPQYPQIPVPAARIEPWFDD